MKVQPITNNDGSKRWVLLDDNYYPIEPAMAFIKDIAPFSSPNTVRGYCYKLLSFYQFLAACGLTLEEVYDIEDHNKPKRVIDEYVVFLQNPEKTMLSVNGCSPNPHNNNSVNQYVGVLIDYLTFLQDEDYFPYTVSLKRSKKAILNPHARVAGDLFQAKSVEKNYGKLPTPPKKVDFVTRDQYIEVFKLLKRERDKLIIALAFEAGMRSGEILGLQWQDLSDSGRGLVHIVARDNNPNGARVKNYAEGTVPIPEYVSEMIFDFERNCPTDLPHEFVFMSERRGKYNPLTYNAVYKILGEVKPALSFDFSMHLFRHGYAAEKIMWGYTPETIQSVLRHKHITTTLEIYSHLEYLIASPEIAKKLSNSKIKYGGILVPSQDK